MTPTPAQRDALTRIADEFAGLAHQIRVLTKESDDAPAPYILVEMDGATPAQVEEMLDRIATLAYDTEPEGVTVGVAATANPSTHPLLPAQDAHTPRERTQTRTGGTESGEGGGGAREGEWLGTTPEQAYGRKHLQREEGIGGRQQEKTTTALLAENDALRAQVERVRALVTETGHTVSCGGLSVTDDGCYAGDLARRILATLDGPNSKAAPDCSKGCGNGEAGLRHG